MVVKVLKYILIAILAVVVIFCLLNFEYISKQAQYYVGHVFVTDVQRQNIINEHPVVVVPNQLVIPTLDVVAPIQFAEFDNETAFQEALINGVVHYPGTADVGTEGNAYIFGHSSDYAFSKGKFKTVFALLPKIEIGAEILVSDQNGVQYKYKVYNKFVTDKTNLEVLSQKTSGKSILTLQTSYPIGTALQRYIVQAELERPQN